MMLTLALRNVWRHKLRTSMTLAAVVFGVVGLVLSGGFVRDVFIQLGETLIHSQSGHLQVASKGYFTHGSRSPEKFVIENPGRVGKDISALTEVTDVLTRVHFSGLLNNGRTDWPIVGEGIEPAKEAILGTSMRLVAGRQLTDTDPYGAMLGEGVAKALNLAAGDHITLLVSTAEGALNNLELQVVGVFQSFSQDFDARAVRIPLAAAQEALGSNRANTLVVSLRETRDTAAVAEQLLPMLRERGLEVRTWVQLNDFYEKTIALYERQFGFLQLIVLAMVLLSVSNTVNMSVFERTGEFGTMFALGNRRRHVFQLILTESALLGVIGGALGIVLGIALALGISAVGIPMPPPPNANLGYTALIRIVPDVLVMAFLVGWIGTALAALLPAARVARTPVIEALRANV